MYKDIEMKLSYYKEQIVKDLISRGIYPDNRLIQSKINAIEMRLAIFRQPDIAEGTKFDVHDINRCIRIIYDDLKILYKLLYEITVNDYKKLNYYIDSHLRELNDMATMYLKKAELESYTTSLGKTVLFKHNDFDVDIVDGGSLIKLGKVSAEQASKVACIADINNADYKNVIVKLKDGDNVVRSNLYNYNHDLLEIPGESKIKKYSTYLSDNQIINNIVELPVIINNINSGKCITLAGKDKIIYKEANADGDIVEEKPVAINALSFKKHSYIDFYVIDGSSITFKFNKKPIATNFNINLNKIKNLNYIHHFFIECDSDFSFDFELEKGEVYAVKENSLIERNKIFYSGQIDIKDFVIVHYLENEYKEFEIEMEVSDHTISIDDINSIMIKKIE